MCRGVYLFDRRLAACRSLRRFLCLCSVQAYSCISGVSWCVCDCSAPGLRRFVRIRSFRPSIKTVQFSLRLTADIYLFNVAILALSICLDRSLLLR